MPILPAFLVLLVLSVPLAAGVAVAEDEAPPPRLSPRGLHRRLVRDPIDPSAPTLVQNAFSQPRTIDAPLSSAEVGASVVGRVVVKLEGPFSDSLLGYQVFADTDAARRAYAATTVAGRADVRLVARTTEDTGTGAPGQIECEHFVREGRTDGLSQCKFLVAEAGVIVFAAISETGPAGEVSLARREAVALLVRAAIAHGRTRGYWKAG